jgi:hypothetical protein
MTTGTEPTLTTDDEQSLSDMLGEALAYPWGDVTNGGVMGGLTKRELFAAMAMGHLAAAHVQGGDGFYETAAKQAVAHADSLLKELVK